MLSHIPYDIQLIIYRYLHELNMKDVLNELVFIINKKENILNYLKKKSFYPYILWNRMIPITNNYYMEIDRYIHQKRLKRTIKEFIFNL